MSKYSTVRGELGKRLKESISEPPPHFILEGERCPFLNENNLCDIYINLGEACLCDICRLHPRFNEWFGDTVETGLGLCCESAAALIFQNSEKTYFIERENQEQGKKIQDILYENLLKCRDFAFEIVQNREYAIEERIAFLLLLAQALQEDIDNEHIENIPKTLESFKSKAKAAQSVNIDIKSIEKILKILEKLEPIDEKWEKKLAKTIKNLPVLLKNREIFRAYFEDCMYEYEHLAVYFVYRYFLKASFDEDLLSKIKLCAISHIAIMLFDIDSFIESKGFGIKDRIENAKLYSKEVEYSQENLDFLADQGYIDKNMATEKIISSLI